MTWSLWGALMERSVGRNSGRVKGFSSTGGKGVTQEWKGSHRGGIGCAVNSFVSSLEQWKGIQGWKAGFWLF